MANRIIVSTLYQTSGGICLLNVSPRALETFSSNDQVFLVLKIDETVENVGTSASYVIQVTSGANPFSIALPASATTIEPGVPTLIGTLAAVASQTTCRYNLSVVYNGNTYSEDPQIQVNPD